MLDQDEQAALRESIEKVRQRVAAHLRADRSSAATVDFVSHLHRAVDKVVQQSGGEHGLACKAGCAGCCSVRVEASEPEVFRIARAIRQREPAQVQALIERLRERVGATAGDPMNTRRIDCAFLVDALCSIYEVRPAVCRKAHSLAAESCMELASEIPQKIDILLGAEALMRGTATAYRTVGLQVSAHELCQAVLAALDDETAEARWCNGEEPLASPAAQP